MVLSRVKKISRLGIRHDKQGLCHEHLLKFINDLSADGRRDREGGAAIWRSSPVKFSSTIHGVAEKKKRPDRALFLSIFFRSAGVAPALNSGVQAL
ncbi:hypothetical protein [Paraburkholderia sp. RAU2J]|uniref:hypothetical protein n=1 Tax=Paraburkholderia sp. RAU2J TaxID=1938810 RepID=UPI0011C48C53|nr:hypothetical protein [Paraburkholderia sp. RAU2J]